MRAALQARGLAVSHVVATGNEAVLRADHFIDAFIDAGTGVVVAYVEQIRDPAAFLIVAAKARKAGVPIVLVHPGASERGAAAAASHTGAMAGEYKVMQTIVRAEGVVMVDTMDELIDATVILNRFPKPSEKGVAIVTNSGAIKGLSLDFCETVGMPVAPLSETDRAALAAMLPPHSEIDNPFDVGTSGYGDASVFAKSSEVMLENPEAGPVLLALTGGGPWQQKAKGEAVAPVAAKAKKPVVLAITGDEAPLDPGCIAAMRENQSPLFRSPERALRALSAIRRQAIALRDLADAAPAPKKLPKPPGGGVLPEYRGKDYLRALGVAVPEGALAQTLEGGEAIAARIGYPIAIKAQGETLAHKSEYGGVIIGVKGKDHLRTEWARLLNNVSGHKLDGVLVEKMGESGVELVIGGRNDPQWGPIVVFGLGGVIVEALDAIEMLPAHANKNQIKERLLAMRGAKLLGPFRRRPARDIDAICDVIMRVGAVLRAEPTLREVDINPLVALAEGQGALALDALFVFD
jgi:acyl-CoA synthetase (NDP forming)